ncbi:MAG: tetraacyldisaccharide 4'-kinase, partial [Bacteroidales bacterium]
PVFDARQQVMVNESQRTAGAFAVAGIARPERFFDALAAAGVPLAGQAAFPDHHWYSRADLARIVASARAAKAERVLTTEKDFVRLLPLRPFPMPVDVVRLEFAIEPADGFRDWLIGRLAAARSGAPSAEAHA